MKKLNLLLLALLTTSCLFGQTWEWAKAYHSNSSNSISSINETSDGDIVISGIIQDTTIFGTDTLVVNGVNTLGFIAKMTVDGTPIWAKTMFIHNGTPQSPVSAVYTSVASDNSILLSSHFADSLVIENQTLYNTNGGMFIALFDSEGNFQWAKNFGDNSPPGTNVARASENFLDEEDNIYLTGTFHDTAYFETNTLLWEAGEIFIVKFDKFGNEQWVNQCGKAGGWQRGYDITTDDFKNVYITGTVSSGESQFGSTIITTPSWRNNTYTSKLDSLGNFQWTITGGAPTDFLGGGQIIPSTYGLGIETDGSDKVYFTGFFSDTVQFGNELFYPTCGHSYCINFFLAAYDMEGNFKWFVQTEVETPSSSGSDIKVDDEGNVYILGAFQDSIAFDDLSVVTSLSSNARDLFIAKFNPDGQCIGLLNSDTDTNGGRMTLSCLNQSIHVGSRFVGPSGKLEPLGVEESPKLNIFVAAISNSFECELTSFNNEITDNYLSVYPNPFGDYFLIDFTQEGSAHYQFLNLHIYNSIGQLVQSSFLENKSKQIDCKHLESGLYYLQLSDVDGRRVGEAVKLVKVE